MPSKYTHKEQVHAPCLVRRRRGQRSTRHVNGVKGGAVFTEGFFQPSNWEILGMYTSPIVEPLKMPLSDLMKYRLIGFPHMGYHNP